MSPDSRDINIATRRVEAAIHAFGGFVKPKQMLPHRPTSIFRLKGHRKTPSKEFYDDRFHDRYFVNDNHISWELEENPPIISSKPSRHPPRRTHAAGHDDQSPDYIDDQSYHSERKSTSGGDCSFHSTSSVISPDNQKMKYR